MFTTMARQAGAALRILVVFTILLGVAYPLAVWAVARIPGLADRAEGAVLTANGVAAGSALIGIDPVPANPAADPWFHARPSASAKDVLGPADTTTSGGSNKGGFDGKLLAAIVQRRALIATREGVAPALVPPDAVTASGSGLDPDISPEYAQLQVTRVARVTGLPVATVEDAVAAATSGRALGFLGEPTVHVTELNLRIAAARPGAG